MENTPPLHVAAQIQELPVIRRYVEERAFELGAGPDAVDELTLAVDEIITNTIVHGYAGQEGGIEITVETTADLPPCSDQKSSQKPGDGATTGLVVRMVDDAPLFDPTSHPAPDLSLGLDQREPGGLGLYLTRKFTDEMLYCARPQGGNDIRLIKWIHRT